MLADKPPGRELRQTTHRHLLRDKAGCWRDLDGYPMGVGGDDFWSPCVHPVFLLPARQYRYYDAGATLNVLPVMQRCAPQDFTAA